MFGNTHFDRVRQMFADQFEPDGKGFLYRKSARGAPIRVTETERDRFVESFNQRIRYTTWWIVPLTILLIGLLTFFAPDVDSASSQVAIWVGIGLILAPFLLFYYWAWNAPSRELERRPMVGAERSREEIRRIMFAKLTYRQLAFVPLAAVAMVWNVSEKNDVFHGWGRLWLVFGGGLIAIACVQAIRKWIHERN